MALAAALDVDADDQWAGGRWRTPCPGSTATRSTSCCWQRSSTSPVTPSVLAPLLDSPQDRAKSRVDAALEQLVDAGLLRTSAGGAVWRDPRLQDAVRAWMRSTMRRRLHARVARNTAIPSGSRIRHWIAAEASGSWRARRPWRPSTRAARAATTAAPGSTCSRCSSSVRCRTPRPATRPSCSSCSATPACGLSLTDEAGTAYGHALDLAVRHVLPQTARLRRKATSATDPRALELTPEVRTLEWSSALSSFAVRTTTTPAEMQEALTEAITSADAAGDVRSGIEARLLLAGGVHLPRRDFGAVHDLVERAVAMGPSPTVRLRAEVLVNLAGVLLGEAADRRERLATAATVADHLGAERTSWHVLGLRVLVAHDLGLPAFDELFEHLS